MNEAIHPDSASNVPWTTSDHRVRVPDTSLLPGSEKAGPAAVGLLNHAVQGAHDTDDCLADRAVPAAQQPGERVSAVGDAVHAKTEQPRDTRDAWMASARAKVRTKPLALMAAALALGAVIARITR